MRNGSARVRKELKRKAQVLENMNIHKNNIRDSYTYTDPFEKKEAM